MEKEMLFDLLECLDEMGMWEKSPSFDLFTGDGDDPWILEEEVLFVTLTVRNCSEADLRYTVGKLQDAFYSLMEIPEVKRVFGRYFKALEVSQCRTPLIEGFHPHLHCFFVVDKSYFNGRNYISRAKLRALWKEALGVDYEPMVDIRRMKRCTEL